MNILRGDFSFYIQDVLKIRFYLGSEFEVHRIRLCGKEKYVCGFIDARIVACDNLRSVGVAVARKMAILLLLL